MLIIVGAREGRSKIVEDAQAAPSSLLCSLHEWKARRIVIVVFALQGPKQLLQEDVETPTRVEAGSLGGQDRTASTLLSA